MENPDYTLNRKPYLVFQSVYKRWPSKYLNILLTIFGKSDCKRRVKVGKYITVPKLSLKYGNFLWYWNVWNLFFWKFWKVDLTKNLLFNITFSVWKVTFLSSTNRILLFCLIMKNSLPLKKLTEKLCFLYYCNHVVTL